MRSETPEVRTAEAKQALPDDAGLVTRVAGGDRTAYAQLVLRHADRFLRLAERLLGERAEAEDAVQDAFGRLWIRADSFDPARARFTTWFYRVVANACHDRLRRRRTEPLPAAWDAADPAPDAEAGVAAGQRAAAVQTALAALPERQRLAMVLSYYEELSNEEAAAAMDVSVKALESLLVRARRTLRESLMKEAERA